MHTKTLRMLAASGLLFACAAQAWPVALQGPPAGRPARMEVACEIHQFDGKGEIESWKCIACIGGICSPTWLSDTDQSGTY